MTSCTCPCSSPSAFEREERVDPLLARLPDPDEDPARERDRELAREADRLETPRRDLVGRGPVRPALLAEPLRRRLEHDPHRGGDRPQRFQLRARHDPGIEVRQQARLLEHEPRAALEVLERRLAAERAQLLARDLVAQLRLVAEREERLVAAGRRARARDREHLLLGHERALAASRRPRERAVAAHVAAERRERDEDLRRVRDERPRSQTTRLREQLLERCGEKVGGAHHPVASIRRDRALAFVYKTRPTRKESDEVPVPDPRRCRGRGRVAPGRAHAIVEEHMAYATMLRERGVYVLGDALDEPRSSVVVRPGESPIVTRRPIRRDEGGIGGFYVVDVESRDERSSSPGRYRSVRGSRSRCSRSPRSDKRRPLGSPLRRDRITRLRGRLDRDRACAWARGVRERRHRQAGVLQGRLPQKEVVACGNHTRRPRRLRFR